MADTKVSAMTENTDPQATDLVYLSDGGTDKKIELETLANYFTPRGYIDGLTLSNNSTDSDHDIDLSTGAAKDGGNGELMTQSTSPLVKQLDATWSVGTNAGGLDTGAIAADTWYHVWLIKRSDTAVVDMLFSTSATAPTMPTNYDLKRRIGAVLTNSSSNIRQFLQYGSTFVWDVPERDHFSSDNPGTTRTTITLDLVPTGIEVVANAFWTLFQPSGSATEMLVLHPDQTNTAPGPANHTFRLNTSDEGTSSYVPTRTNTSAQCTVRLDSSATGTSYQVAIEGWIDPRGQNA